MESGAIGFAIYALMWGTLLLYAWSMPPLERSLWIVVALSWAVGVFTLTWEHYKPTWLMMSLITTAWANGWRERREP